MLDGVGADVDVALGAVIPKQDRLVHPPRNGQANFAVALARRRCLELGDALFEIRAAVSPEIGCGGGHRPTPD